jgi:hypothetical protein
MTFISRRIDVKITYKANGNVLTLSGHRVICTAVCSGGVGMGQLQLRIFGMTPEEMNDLSTTGLLPGMYQNNVVQVFAGDDNGTPLNQVYSGTITAAYADMMNAPEVSFVIVGMAGVTENLLVVQDSSYPGSVDAADIIKNLTGQMGLTFDNSGNASQILRDQTLIGTARQQAYDCARNAGFEILIWNGTLSIWKKNGKRIAPVPTLGADNGMVGYPSYSGVGLVVTALYSPDFVFGAEVEIKSDLKIANGIWQTKTMTHEISANLPNGPWFTQLLLSRPGYLVVP